MAEHTRYFLKCAKSELVVHRKCTDISIGDQFYLAVLNPFDLKDVALGETWEDVTTLSQKLSNAVSAGECVMFRYGVDTSKMVGLEVHAITVKI
jgi:hypothetical protein